MFPKRIFPPLDPSRSPLPPAKQQAAELPLLPGVYQFLNKNGEIIYVGKAKVLRRRVISYFVERNDHAPKVRIMVRQIVEIRHIVVSTEQDALLLENNMIKSLQPRYNVLLKDDKTYPWIVIRDEPFPRVESTRRIERDGSRYFGPYASVTMQREALELIKSIFPLRTCNLNLSDEAIAAGKYRVCLEYHIGNCKGPCEGRQSREEYDESVARIARMLKGEWGETRRMLEQGIQKASAGLHFEQAKRLQTSLDMLDHYTSRSVIVNDSPFTLDVFSMILDSGSGYCNFTRIFKGAVVGSFNAEITTGAEEEPAGIASRALMQMAERLTDPLAAEVVVESLPEAALFPDTAFTVPKRGDKVRLLEFSQRSARLFRLERLKNLEIRDPDRHVDRVMEAMRLALHMETQPRHIECFDNSNLQGTNPVAACVVFRDGKPSKKDYRHYNVKTVEGPDDFATMREIVHRRYSRLLAEGAEMPQLIVVDGGKGQLSSAYEVLKELGLENKIRIVGLAKRIEEVFFPNDPDPYYLDRNGEPLRIMMHIRDEAHRFGITFHRNQRSKSFISSSLNQVPGLGDSSVAKLLKRFKSVAGVRRAAPEQLAEVVGKARAAAVIAHFAAENPAQDVNK